MHSRPDDWDEHWTAYARAAEQNPAQAYRRRLVVDILRSHDEHALERILDVGSGTGALAAELRRAIPAADIVGLELSREGIERARQAVPEATFVQRDLLRDSEIEPRLRGWATAAVCSEVLEHVDEPRRLLQAVVPYLAPGCRLVVTAPGGPMSAFDRAIGHRRHFTPHALRRLLEDSGFRVQWTRRSGFPFFNLYRLVVIARGERLARDVHAAEETRPTVAVAVMSAFDRLFRFNLDRTPFGWQIMALATLDRPG
ncbi:MAG: class I SAM-dependent methyltransferase [Actinobacteria bacterium]|nr:MAG: class I SAM-dependent methyltransferase [Actinomycetota bacterium]